MWAFYGFFSVSGLAGALWLFASFPAAFIKSKNEPLTCSLSSYLPRFFRSVGLFSSFAMLK